jgi:hypothetical protein
MIMKSAALEKYLVALTASIATAAALFLVALPV